MGMHLNLLITLLTTCFFLISCGSDSNGPGGSPSASLFQRDMKWLASDTTYSAKALDTQMNGALQKAFGGIESSDVHNFISERVKYVYSFDEIMGFPITVRQQGQTVFSGKLKELMGEEEAEDDGPLSIAGVNIGAGLAFVTATSDLDIKIRLPVGEKQAGSFRLGLVGIAKAYSYVEDADGKLYARPPEARVSVLVHEGRHSDCPNGATASDCGFMHSECTTGPAKGYVACDNSFWGPYAMDHLYLRGALNKYPMDSIEARIIEIMVDDSASRLTSQQMEALFKTEPELNSY